VRFPNLDAWLAWQETLNPKGIDLGLERVRQVWGRMGKEPLAFPVITVAGTNGKGSCVAMLDAIYRAAGYRTACYTSPHLLRYTERIRCDGDEVDEQALCEAFERVDQARGAVQEARSDAVPLTFFEFGTLAALDLFRRWGPDVAILEVGLGGRLDAVNLVDPDVALVTTIARDHTAWLGDSLDAIALEKAGILRPGRPAVIGSRSPPLALRARAVEIGAEVRQLGREFDASRTPDGWHWQVAGAADLAMPLPALRGDFQLDNAAAVLAAVAALKARLPVPVNALRQGLQRVRLGGRFQVLPGEPALIVDVAHNGQAAESLAANLRAYPCSGRRHAVLGVLRDKAIGEILAPLVGLFDTWDLAEAADPRALPVAELRTAVMAAVRDRSDQADIVAHATVETALLAARGRAEPGDCIVVFGSFTTAEAALRLAGSP
jgi:dihydrofolate synthase/folylpolyglutamate synthase